MVMIKESLDAHDESSCYYQTYNETIGPEFVHEWPPPTVEGFFQGETKAIDLYVILFSSFQYNHVCLRWCFDVSNNSSRHERQASVSSSCHFCNAKFVFCI